MKIKGLKKIGNVPEKVKTKNGNLMETGETIALFKAPDGTKGTYNFFVREGERGRLHGCLFASSGT